MSPPLISARNTTVILAPLLRSSLAYSAYEVMVMATMSGTLAPVARNREGKPAEQLPLTRALERLMPQIRRLDILHFTRLAREGGSGDHAEFLAACRRRDADTAAELVEANYLRLGEQMATILEQDE